MKTAVDRWTATALWAGLSVAAFCYGWREAGIVAAVVTAIGFVDLWRRR